MTVTFCPATRDLDGHFMHHEADGYPMVNMSNRNAGDVLTVLGLTDPPDARPAWIGTLDLDDFNDRLTVARALSGMVDQAIPTVTSGRVITVGRPAGYINNRLADLARLTEQAEMAGHRHIGWH